MDSSRRLHRYDCFAELKILSLASHDHAEIVDWFYSLVTPKTGISGEPKALPKIIVTTKVCT